LHIEPLRYAVPGELTGATAPPEFNTYLRALLRNNLLRIIPAKESPSADGNRKDLDGYRVASSGRQELVGLMKLDAGSALKQFCGIKPGLLSSPLLRIG
jgi:hypothetical protein